MGRKLNVQKKFRRRPEHLIFVQFTTYVQGAGSVKARDTYSAELEISEWILMKKH